MIGTKKIWILLMTTSNLLGAGRADIVESHAAELLYTTLLTPFDVAKDPRLIHDLAKRSPGFAASRYYKCVAAEFAADPEISKEPGFWQRAHYATGIDFKRTSAEGYFKAVKVQYGCTRSVVRAIVDATNPNKSDKEI